MVAISIESCRARTGTDARRWSRSARTSGVHARFDWMTTSDAIIARASPISPARTLWMSERRVTIAPTPIATQMKKNSRRRHEARSSRAVMRRTKLTG